MKSMTFKGKPVSEDASKVCVLYDPRDGRVVHVHGVTILDGGKAISLVELEQRAMNHARTFGRSLEGVKALHLPLSALRQHRAFKVNGEGTGLVPLPSLASMREALTELRRAKAGKRS